jgi:hypothetical protein
MLPSSRLRWLEFACELRRGSPKPEANARRHAVRIHSAIMARQSLAARVTALEEKVGHKTIEEQFREQAELIDRRFDEGFRDQAELIDRLFLERDKKWDLRFGNMEKDVSVLKSDVSILKKDMTFVREGLGILLKRRR